MIQSLFRCVRFLVGGAVAGGFVFVILVHAFLKR